MAYNHTKIIEDNLSVGTYTGTTLVGSIQSPDFGCPTQTIATGWNYAVATLDFTFHVPGATATSFGVAYAKADYYYTGGTWNVGNLLDSSRFGIITSLTQSVSGSNLRVTANFSPSTTVNYMIKISGEVSFYTI